MQHISTPAQAGRIMTARRKAMAMAQRELAAKLGISQNRLSELEEQPGKLTLERFLAMLNLLGMELTIHERGATAKGRKAEW